MSHLVRIYTLIQWRLVEKIADRLSINDICNNWDSEYDVNTEIFFFNTQYLSKVKKGLLKS